MCRTNSIIVLLTEIDEDRLPNQLYKVTYFLLHESLFYRRLVPETESFGFCVSFINEYYVYGLKE